MANLGETENSTPMQINDAKLPTSGGAIIHLELGQYEYIELDLGTLTVDGAKQAIETALDLKKYKDTTRAIRATRAGGVQPKVKTTAPTTEAPAKSAAQPNAQKLDKFKPDKNVAYQVKIISDNGEFTGGYGGHNFVVEVGGVQYEYVSNVKNGLVIQDCIGKELTICLESKTTQDGKPYSKYSITDGAVKLI